MIRRLKRRLGIRFSTKALMRNPGICFRQYLRRYQSFTGLAEALATRRPVSIVQIGANDGSANDPLRHLFATQPARIARALLIEPQTGAFHRLSERYADAGAVYCLNAAINRAPGEATIWSIDKPAVAAKLGRAQSDGIASFDRAQVANALRMAGGDFSESDLEALLITETVRVVTLEQAAAEAGINQPDILLVDTEGFDAEIMDMVLTAGWRPALLQFEHKLLTQAQRGALSKRLRSQGYRLWADHADVWGQRVGIGTSPE